MEQTLQYGQDTKTVIELLGTFKDGRLNLEPGFQRQSVWTERDRAKLIDSIVCNYPLPSIFLYKRQDDDGQVIYDVIDGKQRLESIFKFMNEMPGRYWAKLQLSGEQDPDWFNWHKLCKRKIQHLVNEYAVPVTTVDGELGNIIEIFVRINSTGKALTRQEKLHARYYNSYFLKQAASVARRFESYFREMNVLSDGQMSRMKHIELSCELMLSIHQNDVINKKAALDRVMKTESSLSKKDVDEARQQTIHVLQYVKRMFPELKRTRFSQLSDFYTLIVLLSKLDREDLILNDRKRNRLAWDLLLIFSTRVDEMREKLKKGKGTKPGDEVYRDYLDIVSQMTDNINQRRKREEILKGIMYSLFAIKDKQRGFSPEQRRILWNSATTRRCPGKKCGGKLLSWDDFTIDHIDPYSKGGRSRLENAALMCSRCNSSKGSRKK